MAPDQIVIVPIIREPEGADAVVAECQRLAAMLRQAQFAEEKLRVFVDLRDDSSATKRWNWLKKGVPLVCELGPRDLAGRTMRVQSRLDLDGKPLFLGWDELTERFPIMLAEIQQTLFAEAESYRTRLTRTDITSWDSFRAFFETDTGFVEADWCGEPVREAELKELGVTIRCILPTAARGHCVLSGGEARYRVIFAKAY
jgi:prolyl-tRNA synthetase